jgi:hypothetical protein
MADSAPFSSGLAAQAQTSHGRIPLDCAEFSIIRNICVGSARMKTVTLHHPYHKALTNH